MIGYRVIAKAAENYVRAYSGWYEGSPALEGTAKVMASKAVMAKVVNLAAGGPVGTVANIVGLPFQALGAGVGAAIAQGLIKINTSRAENAMGLCAMDVTLSGDVEPARYMVESHSDMADLPKLLALIPQKGTTDKFLGAGVLEAAFMAHANYARHLGNQSAAAGSVNPLSVHIAL